MHFDAVLFDMDGLLVDSEPIWTQVTDAFCQRRGQRYTAADEAACLGSGIGITMDYLSRTYGWPLDRDAQVDEVLDELVTHLPSAPELPGASALLEALAGSGIPLALGSSSARRVVDAALGARGWLPRFATIVSGSDVTRLKPDPEIYLTCAQRLGVAPERCVVLEDSPVGCRAARAAGAHVIAVPALPHDAQRLDRFRALADHVVPDLASALGVLGRG